MPQACFFQAVKKKLPLISKIYLTICNKIIYLFFIAPDDEEMSQVTNFSLQEAANLRRASPATVIAQYFFKAKIVQMFYNNKLFVISEVS